MDRTILFSVRDFKVYPMTAIGDASTAPTYGAAVDVPGVSEVALEASVVEQMLRGDGRVIDVRGVLETLDLSFTYAKLDPAVLAVIDGGTVSTNAGGDTTRYVRGANDLIPDFGFAALIDEVDTPGGAAKLYGYRAKVSGGEFLGATDNEYTQPTFDATVYPVEEDPNPMFGVDLEDTLTALPADGTALVATYAALT